MPYSLFAPGVLPRCSRSATKCYQTLLPLCSHGQHQQWAVGSKIPVVEHKGSGCVLLVFCPILRLLLASLGDAFSAKCIPPGMQHEKDPATFGNGGARALIERGLTMPQRSIRFPEATNAKVQAAVLSRGFESPTAFIRYAVDQELSGRRDNLAGVEERLAGTIAQMRRELFRLGRGQQALFAYIDSLAKVLLTCIPEPPQDMREQAIVARQESGTTAS